MSVWCWLLERDGIAGWLTEEEGVPVLMFSKDGVRAEMQLFLPQPSPGTESERTEFLSGTRNDTLCPIFVCISVRTVG